MEASDKRKITEDLLDYATEQVGKYHDAFISGMLLGMLTDEQWKQLEQKVNKETLFKGVE